LRGSKLGDEAEEKIVRGRREDCQGDREQWFIEVGGKLRVWAGKGLDWAVTKDVFHG